MCLTAKSTAPSFIPNLLRFDRASEEDAVNQNVADLMDIYTDLEPKGNFDFGKTELKEERKGKRGSTKKYRIITGNRAGLFSKLNTNNMLFNTRMGLRMGKRSR